MKWQKVGMLGGQIYSFVVESIETPVSLSLGTYSAFVKLALC